MTGTELMAAVIFFLAVLGSISALWWRIEGKVESAKSEALREVEKAEKSAHTRADAVSQMASLTNMQLAEYKTHVAETYITKAGMRESTEHIMEAIGGMRSSIDSLSGRVDRVLDTRPINDRQSRGGQQ
ncbi:MAG: hypothetical protein V7704_08055 [Aurantimonas endophytica]|uniref:hypothetical protein n=1 Tax=Aurantimonas endophytica TaxID=1522175 RepID=UPI0030031248